MKKLYTLYKSTNPLKKYDVFIISSKGRTKKVSFGAKKLQENAMAFFDSLKSHKPTGLKGSYVKTTSISTTQGPGIKVENIVN